MQSEPNALDVPDPDFPSGTWQGYYEQGGKRHPQEMKLEFAGGHVRGEGHDGIGPFTVRGSFDSSSLRVSWTKSYRWHRVRYYGLRVPDGIRGTWRLWFEEDGFHLWPGGSAEGATERAAAEASTPASTARPRRERTGAPSG
ncbi:MAG TPA: hypothetical protein VF530_19660 [Planctomycetota bacterium]